MRQSNIRADLQRQWAVFFLSAGCAVLIGICILQQVELQRKYEPKVTEKVVVKTVKVPANHIVKVVKADGKQQPVTPKMAPRKDPWQKASNVATDNDVLVNLISAEIGKIKVKSFGQETTLEKEYLSINVALTNLSQYKKLNYRTWAGGAFGSDGIASLEDDVGNTYQRIHFGAAAEIVGQKTSESIYPRTQIDDVLVFEVPVNTAQYLRLTLPRTAYLEDTGDNPDLKIKIPVSVVTK